MREQNYKKKLKNVHHIFRILYSSMAIDKPGKQQQKKLTLKDLRSIIPSLSKGIKEPFH